MKYILFSLLFLFSALFPENLQTFRMEDGTKIIGTILSEIDIVFDFITSGSATNLLDFNLTNAIANQIVIFDNTWHYGVTQSDIPRRILLNMNVAI